MDAARAAAITGATKRLLLFFMFHLSLFYFRETRLTLLTMTKFYHSSRVYASTFSKLQPDFRKEKRAQLTLVQHRLIIMNFYGSR
jgi:hypothetical protein